VTDSVMHNIDVLINLKINFRRCGIYVGWCWN